MSKTRMSLASLMMLAFILPLDVAVADDPVIGVQYELISPEQKTENPAKVEVRELFWYGCPHCYDLEPMVHNWIKHKPAGTDFVRQPAIPNKRWAYFAKVFYTAEILGVLDKFHKPFFDALHKDKKKMKTDEEVAAFFKEQGVSDDEFNKTWNSFAVATKVSRATQMTRKYGITSVPTFVVNGRYRTNARMAGGADKIFEVVDFLVAKEKEQMEKNAASTK